MIPGLGHDVSAFTPQRLEFEARANFDRWTLQLMYGDYAPQPEIGFLTEREEMLAGASVKVTQNWVVLGSVRYDLAVDQFDQTRFGVGYTDDCLLISLNYLTSYIYTGYNADAEQLRSMCSSACARWGRTTWLRSLPRYLNFSARR